MARRITDITKDVSIVNKEFARIDLHESQLDALSRRQTLLEQHTSQIRDTRQITSTNNLVFTWTGSTLTLSWAAGYVQDSSLRNWNVAGGSQVVVASTVYWLAWNPRQQRMAISQNLSTLMTGIVTGSPDASAGNNLIVCSVKTGTAGQSGTAGGGGSDPGGVGPSGKEYSVFAGGGGGGTGTVTSVAETVPAEMTIAGSPVTTSGTLALGWNSASGNKVIASPAGGGSGAYAGRALVALDIPNIAESQVTSLVSDLALKAPLASPALTGTPTSPTAGGGTNTTQIATTAFVQSAVSGLGGGSVTSVTQTVPTELTISGSPVTTSGTLALGWASASGNKVIASPAAGGSGAYAGRALVALDIPNIAESQVTSLVSDLALKAPLASPTFTGTPAAPTPSLTDNSTKLATTAFVQAFTPGGGGAAAGLDPDTPPVSAGSLDDEFTGASLDLVRWTWFNQGSATATEGSGYLALKTTSSTDVTNGIYQTAPATPWEVTTKMIMPTVFNSITSMAFGIMIADATKECQIGWRPNSPSTLFFNYPGTGSFASSQTIVGYNWTAVGGSFPYVYWRVRDNGTNIIVSMSVDGLIWTQMASNSRTAYLPAGPTRVGLFIDGNGNASATFASYGVFDWFRRTL